MTFLDFVRNQWRTPPPVADADLTGKTVMVVGANVGLGFEAAKHFARMNPARLILACRSQEKGNAAIASLQQETGFSGAEMWMIDLGELSSVKNLVDKFDVDGGRLDILVENAAVAVTEYNTTPDGWESTLQVNYLALSLLALLLLPRMLQTAKDHTTTPRLVVVSSGVHHSVTIDPAVAACPKILQALSSRENSSPQAMKTRYHVSKLLNVFFTRSLNAHLPLSSPMITVTAANPGYCRSALRRNIRSLSAVYFWLMDMALAFSTEVGSRQLVYAAVGGDDRTMRGGYVSWVQGSASQ